MDQGDPGAIQNRPTLSRGLVREVIARMTIDERAEVLRGIREGRRAPVDVIAAGIAGEMDRSTVSG